MTRLDDLHKLSESRPEDDYGPGGNVERSVRQFLYLNRSHWFLRSRIAMATGFSVSRLDPVLTRLVRRGEVQMMGDGKGHLLYRGC